MKVTIDKAGRLVVPKEIRTKLQIRPGDELEIEAGVDSIEIRPVVAASVFQRERGLWCHRSGDGVEIDVVQEIDRVREERIRAISR